MGPLPAALMLTAGCTGRPAPTSTDSGPGRTDSLVVATQNAGTTPYMDALGETPHRAVCEQWYDNNLCLAETEALLADALEDVDIALLQEMWDAPWCDEPDRPAGVQQAPYACSLSGPQTERVLPVGSSWACAEGYRDNCIGWDPEVFLVDGACDGRDCSAAMTSLTAPCAGTGRAALVEGELYGEPAALVVIHTNAGYLPSDAACRAEELGVVADALAALPADTRIVAGGDVNHDPSGESVDAQAFAALLDRTGATRLPDDGPTAVLLQADLDAVFTRGVLGAGACTARFVDAAAAPRMLDHALLTCADAREK